VVADGGGLGRTKERRDIPVKTNLMGQREGTDLATYRFYPLRSPTRAASDGALTQ
jgi:hypothetical protein